MCSLARPSTTHRFPFIASFLRDHPPMTSAVGEGRRNQKAHSSTDNMRQCDSDKWETRVQKSSDFADVMYRRCFTASEPKKGVQMRGKLRLRNDATYAMCVQVRPSHFHRRFEVYDTPLLLPRLDAKFTMQYTSCVAVPGRGHCHFPSFFCARPSRLSRHVNAFKRRGK